MVKKEAEEKKIGVTVISDKEEVAAGDTVTFTAEVKNGDETIEDAKVSWKIEGEEVGFEDRELSVSVKEDETRDSLTVVATYTDADGNSFESDSATVTIIKASETEPDPDEGEDDDDDTKDTDVSGNSLTEETISVTQEAHPIRNFFSSLFK